MTTRRPLAPRHDIRAERGREKRADIGEKGRDLVVRLDPARHSRAQQGIVRPVQEHAVHEVRRHLAQRRVHEGRRDAQRDQESDLPGIVLQELRERVRASAEGRDGDKRQRDRRKK